MFKSLKSVLRRLFTRSIQGQLMLVLMIYTTAILLGLGVFLVTQERGLMMERNLQQARLLAHIVAVGSKPLTVANDMIGLQKMLKSVAYSPDIKYVFLQSIDGRILVSNRVEDVGLYVSDPVSRRLRTASAKPMVLVDNLNLIDVAEPMFAGERLIGWVRVGLGRGELVSNLEVIIQHGYLIVAVAIAVALIVAAMLARSLTTGLQRLIAVANQIRSGGRGVRADVDRSDELGVLAVNFNIMLDTLAESERKLERLNRVYAAWTECSSVIVRETNEKRLLENICRILAECVPFKLAWMGMVDANGWVVPVASSDPASEYINHDIHISINPEIPEGRVPMSVAIRSGIPQWHNNFSGDGSVPWRAAAEKQGFISVAAFPLIRGSRCVGAIAVYSPHRDFFNLFGLNSPPLAA